MADIPEYQRTEKLTPATIPQPFSAAGREIAANSNVLSNIGSDLALKAAVARSELAGIKYGKNPQGDLLPAITESDKAFHEAYRNTAMATLSLQGDELLNKSLVTLSSANKLTPGLIDSFNANVASGFESIASQAPSQDREKLSQNLSASLLAADTKLRAKMIAQQKEDLKDNFAAYASETNSQIFDLSSLGAEEDSKKLLASYEASVREQMQSGLLSRLDGETLLKTSRVTYLTGREFEKAQRAMDNNTLDTFLSDYAKAPPEDMTPTEWVEVGTKLLTLVGLQDRAEQKNQSTLVSEGSLRIARGQVTNEFLLRAQSEMTPDNYNRFLTNLTISQQKEKGDFEEINKVMQNWSKPGVLSHAKDKAVNSAYDLIWQDMQSQSGVDEWTAKTLTAASGVIPVPAYIEELNAKALSGVPNEMQEALTGMKSVNSNRPGNLKGLSDDAKNMLTIFSQSRAGGQDEIVAAETATKAVLEVDETESNRRATEWNIKSASSDMFGDKNQKLQKFAFKQLGVSESNLVDPVGTALNYKNALKNNFYALGNMSAAITKTNEEFNASHDFTYVNGKKKYVFLPVERVLGITKNQLPFVYPQIQSQTQMQVERFNKLYDSKQSDFKYEFASTEIISPEKYTEAKAKLEKILSETSEISETILGGLRLAKGKDAGKINEIIDLKKIVASYETPGRPIITRVDRDGTRTDFFLNIYAQGEGDLYNGLPVYNVLLESLAGETQEFIGANGLLGRSVLYVPDIESFTKDYSTYLQISNSGGAAAQKDMQNKFNEHLRRAKEKIDSRLSQDVNIVSMSEDGTIKIDIESEAVDIVEKE